MQHTPDLQCLLRNLNTTSVFLGWLRQEGDSLIAAASRLGGTRWAKRAHSLVEGARAGHDIAARRKDREALRRDGYTNRAFDSWDQVLAVAREGSG